MISKPRMTTGLELCICGRLPGISIHHAGRTRLYSVRCRCGQETAESDDEAEVISAWNDAQTRARRLLHETGRQIAARIAVDPRMTADTNLDFGTAPCQSTGSSPGPAASAAPLPNA